MKNRVFIIHEPARWDASKKRMVPFDLSSVDDYGERVVIFPGGNRPPPWAEAGPRLLETMTQFKETDFLVIAGDIDFLVWASVLALRATNGKLKLLRWNNRSTRYDISTAPPELWN